MFESRSLGSPSSRALRLLLTALISAAAVALLASVNAKPASAAGLDLQAKAGISVGGQGWIPDGSSNRQIWQADISTSLISPKSINGGVNRIRILVPSNYFTQPNLHFPVLYLLHGGAGGSSRQWTTEGGAAGYITAGRPVITVMAEGGKVGWFTNWVDQSGGAQRWADFYETQLIPFIDNNLRTIPTKQGRAIAGLSMGGYGAVRIAQDRPDLFQAVASFSGALNLQEFGTGIVICEQSIENGYGCGAAFGNDAKKWDPISRGGEMFRNQNIMMLLYAGSGIHDADILERTMGWSTSQFSNMLNGAGITNWFWMYGRPGPASPFACDGGHNFSCWNFALTDAVPRMLPYMAQPTAYAPPPPPPPLPPAAPAGTDVVANGGWESGTDPWICGSGACGRDGFLNSHSGWANGWVRYNSGWNNLYQNITVDPNRNYRVTGWVRTSSNNTAGYFGLRKTNGQVVGEQMYGKNTSYKKLEFTVNSGNNTQLQVFAGFWAVNGDTWVQVDDVSVKAL